MRKFISVLLTCIFLFSSTISCYAEQTKNETDVSLLDLMLSEGEAVLLSERDLPKGEKSYTIKASGILLMYRKRLFKMVNYIPLKRGI